MARQFNETNLITQVVYVSGTDAKQTVRRCETFPGHLSPSEIERRMLFEKRTPRRLIVASEHKFL